NGIVGQYVTHGLVNPHPLVRVNKVSSSHELRLELLDGVIDQSVVKPGKDRRRFEIRIHSGERAGHRALFSAYLTSVAFPSLLSTTIAKDKGSANYGGCGTLTRWLGKG